MRILRFFWRLGGEAAVDCSHLLELSGAITKTTGSGDIPVADETIREAALQETRNVTCGEGSPVIVVRPFRAGVLTATGMSPLLRFASLLRERGQVRFRKAATSRRSPGSLRLIGLLLLSLTGFTRADESPASPPWRELWVPLTDVPVVLKQHPRAVLLTREQYETLRRDASPEPAKPSEAPPVPVVLRSLTLTAQPAGPLVVARAEMSVDVLASVPAVLPLHFEPAVLAALELDESSTLNVAESAPSALLPPGPHLLKATLHLPVAVSAAGKTIAVRGSPAGASSFILTLPSADRVESALTWSTKPGADGTSVHTFTLPQGDTPNPITWSTRDIRDLPGTALVQSCHYVFTVDSVRLHADLAMQFRSRLAVMPASLTIPVPPDARILSVDGSDVLKWTTAADKSAVTVELTPESDRHHAGVTLSLDLPLPPRDPAMPGPRALPLPFPQAANVHRAFGRFIVLTEGDLRVRRVSPPPLAVQNTPSDEDRAALTGEIAGLWDFAAISGSPSMEIEDLAPVFHATQDTQIELKRDAVHLTRHLNVVPRQGRLFAVNLTLPKGEDLITLKLKDGAAVDWRKVQGEATAGTVIEIRFPSGLKPGNSPALLLTSRIDPPQWTTLTEAGIDLSFARAAVAGADKLSGFIAVSAEDRFALTTAAPAGLEQRDPATLGDDVPVRGGLVWFAPGDFTLPLHVGARLAEFDAAVAAFVLPLLHSIEIEGTLDLDIRQSGLREMSVQLPPAVAQYLRFDTPLVSGTKPNAQTGEWAVTFREELRGRQSLRWRMALPVAAPAAPDQPSPDTLREFSADVPVFRVPAARRLSAHWVMEANTDTELSFDSAGLDERDTLTLPEIAGYTPRHRVIAAWNARGTDWRLHLTAKRHQPAALPALVVDRCDLTTSVSTDGTLRHNALLTVRSNGHQFFDLPLPGDARILTLLVNGHPQKPAAASSAALRTQLPAGSITAVSVSVTWETAGQPWNSGGEKKLEPLRLPDEIPVLESHWTLRLPDGFVYSDFQTGMQRENGPRPPKLEIMPWDAIMAAKSSVGGGMAEAKRSPAATSSPDEFHSGGGAGGVTFQVNKSPAPDVYDTSDRSDRSARDSDSWLATETRTIRSLETLAKVVQQLQLDKEWGMNPGEAAAKLEGMIEVRAQPGTEMVNVTATSTNPAESDRISRAVVAAYEARRTEKEEERVRRIRVTIAANITQQEAIVDKARQEMLDMQKKHQIVDMSAPTSNEDQQLLQTEYATAKHAFEMQFALLNDLREKARLTVQDISKRQGTVDLGGLEAGQPSALTRGMAGLLPLDIALPGAGEEFRFRGHQAPGAITFSVRNLHAESRVAWLWIAAGMAAAGLLARRRPIFHGLLGTLLLWLVPWILEAGMGPGHRLLIGWSIGCGFILCFRILSKIRGPKLDSLPAPATVTGAAIFAVLAMPPSPAKAQEKPADTPAVIVPYDPAKPLAEQNPQQVYVNYDQFQKLWKAARDHRLDKNQPAAAALKEKSGAILSALYEVTLAGGLIKIESVLTVHTTGNWATVSLQSDEKLATFAGANIAGLTIDGKAATLHGSSLLVENPGRHVVRASLQAPLTGDWREFQVHLPRAPAVMVSLTHTDASLRLKLNGGVPLEVIEKREGGYQWRGTGALWKTETLRLERLPAVMLAAGTEKPPLGAVRARLFVTPAIERLDSRIDFQFAGAERRDFSFAYDPTLTPVQIDIPNLESWSVNEAGGRRVLDFKLSVPARDTLTAGFVAERPVAGKPGEERAAPAVVPAANRQEYTIEVLNSDDIDIVLRPTGGWARSELSGMGDATETGFRSAGAYRLAGVWSPLAWSATARPLRRSVQADYAWKIAGGILESTVTFTLRAGEHEDLTSLTIPLPQGAALQTLDGERLKDWWRDGDSVELRFSGATAETTTVWLDFTQPVTADHIANGLPLPCLTLDGYDEVKGRGVVATGPENDVRLRLDDKAVFVREVAAEQARGDYTFLPPFKMRRGFTFEAPVFHATALLEAVPPRFAARWVLGAAVQDSWTEAQFRVDVEVRQGALPDIRFVMPAGLPEARVSGDKFRESVRTALADGRSEYRVTFQSPVADAAALIIALELPHKGRLALPDIDFPGAALTERFLILQNFSAGEIVPDNAASSGVEPLSRDGLQELHFKVQGFANPLSWRLKPGWKLAIDYRSLESTSGPQAVVLWAELTTMLRAEGPEWLRAVYHLQNRALQFLPLRLPEDMELISATVAETAVRADTGLLPDGKHGLLIPLIQTRPGDLAMDVEIVCRIRKPAGSRGNRIRKLDDPDIPGVSIQRTLWNVWTPPGWDLDDADGNMERVEEKKNFMEKLEADFEELDLLSSVSRTSRNPVFRTNATQQADVLIAKMEKTVNEKESNSKMSYYREYEGDEEFREAKGKLEALKQLKAEIDRVAATEESRQTTTQIANSEKWVWDFNSSYLIQRSKDSGAAQSREEALIAGNQLLNGGVITGNTAVNAKSAGAKQGDQTKTPPATQSASRRYNSQIAALNEADEKVQDRRPAGAKEAGRKAAADGRLEPKGESGEGRDAAQWEFNNVRGSRRAGVQPATPPGQPGMITIRPEMPKPLFAGTPLPDSSTPIPPANQPASHVSQPARGALAGVAPPPPVATPVPAMPVLKPAGRVSIPVAFPIDGEIHRFRKVNDRASLELTLTPLGRSTSSRWLAAGLLAAGLGVLWLANRKMRRRRTA